MSAGETEEDGYEDEYTLEDLDVTSGDYICAAPVPNFRAAWEALGEEAELGDDYGLGERENLQARPLLSLSLQPTHHCAKLEAPREAVLGAAHGMCERGELQAPAVAARAAMTGQPRRARGPAGSLGGTKLPRGHDITERGACAHRPFSMCGMHYACLR